MTVEQSAAGQGLRKRRRSLFRALALRWWRRRSRSQAAAPPALPEAQCEVGGVRALSAREAVARLRLGTPESAEAQLLVSEGMISNESRVREIRTLGSMSGERKRCQRADRGTGTVAKAVGNRESLHPPQARLSSTLQIVYHKRARAERLDRFHCELRVPYLNCHRRCPFAPVETDAKGSSASPTGRPTSAYRARCRKRCRRPGATCARSASGSPPPPPHFNSFMEITLDLQHGCSALIGLDCATSGLAY